MTEISAKMRKKDRKQRTFLRFPRHSGTSDAWRLFFLQACVYRIELTIFPIRLNTIYTISVDHIISTISYECPPPKAPFITLSSAPINQPVCSNSIVYPQVPIDLLHHFGRPRWYNESNKQCAIPRLFFSFYITYCMWSYVIWHKIYEVIDVFAVVCC